MPEGERVERGKELALRQVTRRAEDDERAGGRRAPEPKPLQERVLLLLLFGDRRHCFSRCPPNACRIADRIRFANSASPRESKRSYRAAERTGAGTDSSIAALSVQRPSPESDTCPAKSSRPGLCSSAAAVRSRSHEEMTLPRRHSSETAATSMS